MAELVEILTKLDRLGDQIESLERTVRGHEGEGNVGIIRRFDEELAKGRKVHDGFDARISALESAVLAFRAKVAGAAALGAAIGAGGTILASLVGLFGAGS